MTTVDEFQQVLAVADLLYDADALAKAIQHLAEQINHTLVEQNPVVLCAMNGGILFAGQLLPHLTIPITLDSINASRYQNKTFGGGVEWLYRPRISLKQRTVLLLDDILDEGVTLKTLYNYCLEDGASKVYSAVLTEKILDKTKPIQADFVGLTVPNRYVFGFGMDYKGYGRNLNAIYACAETAE